MGGFRDFLRKALGWLSSAGGAPPAPPKRVLRLAARRNATLRMPASRRPTLRLQASQTMCIRSEALSYKGEDLLWEFDAGEDTTGWTVQFRVAAEREGAAIAALTRSASTSGTEPNVLQVTQPRADTLNLAAGEYFVALERLDSGQAAMLADVEWTLEPRPAV